jgi:hypothetical protein
MSDSTIDGVASVPTEPPAASTPEKITRGRLVLVDAIIAVATILAVVGIFSVWANRLLFDPDNWENTSTQLLANPTIRTAAANYIVDQAYANVNVAQTIQSALPTRLEPLAPQIAAALRNPAVQAVNLALTRPAVQTLWAKANRAADQTFIAVVNGGKGPVAVQQGAVTLDLAQVVNNLAARLGLPSNLGSKLPPNVANLTVIKAHQLSFVQKVGKAIRHLAFWLTAIVFILYALAIVLARAHHRRTLMSVGFAIIFAGVVALLARRVLDTQITSSLTSDASLRPAISATVDVGTQILREIAAAMIYVGIVLVVAAWFAGPARAARAGRLALAPSLREHAIPYYLVTLAVLALIFVWNPIHATGTPVGMISFTVLALLGMFFLRRQTAREFPDAQPGDTTRRMRARWDRWRHRHDAPAPKPEQPAGETLTDQLARLAELHDHGDLTPDEYRRAKGQLLPS